MTNSTTVFVFQGNNATFSSAVFSSVENAKRWIEKYQLNGTLTEYPMDYPIYDWAIDHGFFKVKNEFHQSPKLIAGFSSAYQKHWHFVDGKCED
jgi:hypothetical protein